MLFPRLLSGMQPGGRLFAATLFGLAAAALLTVIDTDQSFAELSSTHLQDAASSIDSPRTFSRSISDSVSVASNFGDLGARIPRVFSVGISDGLTITTSPTSPAGSSAASTARGSSFTSAGRAEERLGPRNPFESRGDLTNTNVANGSTEGSSQEDTSFDIDAILSMVSPELFSSDDSEPDDNSQAIVLQTPPTMYMDALYDAYGLAVIVLATSKTGTAKAMARRIINSSGTQDVAVARIGRAVVIIAAGTISAIAMAGSATGQAFADTDKAAIVYIQGSTPVYREWIPSAGGGGSWSNAVSLTAADTTLVTARIEFSPISSKRVIVTMDANGALDSYVCFSGCTDTANWTRTNNFVDVAAAAVPASYRPWDIEYEQTSGDLMIVYDYAEAGSSATDDLFYRVMTDAQTAFGSVSSINDSGNAATAGLYSFVAMDSQKTSGSDEMALIAVDATGLDASAIVWNGSNWTTLPQTELSTAVAIATEEAVAIAYEASSGDILVVAGEGTTVRHRTFSNTTNTWGTSSTLTGTWAVGTINWLRLVPDPRSTSNAIFLGGLGAGSDLDSAYWSGSAWTDHTEHDGGTGNNADRVFDFAWDVSSSNGVLVWSTTTNSLSFSRGDPSSASFGTDGTFAVDSGGSNQVQWVRLATNPTTADTVAALGLESDFQSDIGGIRWDGSTNAPVSTGTDGISTASTNNSWEPFSISFQLVPTERDAADSVAFADSVATAINRSRSVSDAVAAGDSISVAVVLTIPLSDSIAVVEGASRLLDAGRAASETLAMADSPDPAIIFSRSVADSVTVTEVVARQYAPSRSVSDSLTVIEEIARNNFFAASPSETIAASDTVARTLLASRSAAETITTADAITVNTSVNKSLSETLAASDALARSYAPSRSAGDSLALTDSAARHMSAARSAPDSISVSDTVTAARLAQVSVSDPLAVSDAAARTHSAFASVADTLSAADSPATTLAASRATEDDIAISDGTTKRVSRSMSETLEIVEDITRRASRSIEDGIAASDSAAASYLTPRPAADALDVADEIFMSVSRSIADSITAADTLARRFGPAVPDGISVTDEITTQKALARSLSETLSAADSAARSLDVSRSASDALAADDGIARSLTLSRSVEDALSAADIAARARATAKSVSDALAIADDVARTNTATRGVSDTVSVSDTPSRSIVVERPVSDALAVLDEASRQSLVSESVSDALGILDEIEMNKSEGRTATDALETADSISISIAYTRAIDDEVAVAEHIFEHPRLRDTLEISDAVSPGLFRSIADDVAVSDELPPPVSGALRELSDTVRASDQLTEVSVQWNRSFDEGLGIGDCTPFACNPMLNLGESLSLGDAFAGPPEIEDAISIVDSIAAGKSFVPAPEETLSVVDTLGYIVQFVPPTAPEGIPELGAMAATTAEMVQPLQAQTVDGTYSMETGDPDDLASQLNLPAVDTSIVPDWSQLVLVLQTYYVTLTPSYEVPADDSMMTITVSEIPANTHVMVPVSIAETPQLSEHAHMPWMTMEYTPAVDSNNFALLITPLEQPPDGSPLPSADTVPLYLDIRWVGDFPGAEDPGVASYYAEAPTFTFALTDEWADSQHVERDDNGVPVITLNLLDRSIDTWEAVTDIDAPTGANSDGEYVYVAHLEHFSTYAVTAEKVAVSGGGGGGRDRFAVEFDESIAIADATRGVAVEIIEEPVGVKYSANLQDSLVLASRPVAYKVLPVREQLDVLVALQGVTQNTGIPPSAKATFEVNAVNAGDSPESFTLEFWYNDEKGMRAFESSQEISVGPHESRQEIVDIIFAAPGTFEVTVEAQTTEGDILNTMQMTVEVPWLTVNFWLVIVVALSIIAESAAAAAYFLRKRKVAVAAGGQTVVVSKNKAHMSLVAWPARAKAGSDLQVSVRIANAAGQRVISGTLAAEVEFEIRNASDSHQEFILACWFEHGTDSWYQRVQLGPHGSDLRKAEVSMPSRGKHMLHIETRDVEYGELLGMLRVGASAY